MENLSLTTKAAKHFYALINYEDEYVQPLILSALESRFSEGSYTLISDIEDLPSPTTPFFQISAYETLPFTQAMSFPSSTLINAYVIRKALIRKHYLSTTAYNWIAKHPESILKTNIKPACEFELDYAEFLDEALVEAWELKESFGRNEGKGPEEREWWILKPGMSDRGQGIRLFSTESELQSIFEEWEAERPDSDDDEKEGDGEKDYVVTCHLRHFIAQPYIHPPLLLASLPQKFHIRTYVLTSGSLSIHVYKPMLALFASVPYSPPWTSSSSLSAHLTNTCLQSPSEYPPVKAFWSLDLSDEMKEDIWRQICETTGEIFEAAAKGMMVHFQTLPNAFEVFGVDFLVDGEGRAWLLEVNAFPDFRQTGDELKGLVGGLWEEVVGRVVGGFFGVETEGEKGEGLVYVRRVELGKKS
jgi:tubulin---tyrosine ligase